MKIRTRLEGWKGRGTVLPWRRSRRVSGLRQLRLMVVSSLLDSSLLESVLERNLFRGTSEWISLL